MMFMTTFTAEDLAIFQQSAERRAMLSDSLIEATSTDGPLQRRMKVRATSQPFEVLVQAYDAAGNLLLDDCFNVPGCDWQDAVDAATQAAYETLGYVPTNMYLRDLSGRNT